MRQMLQAIADGKRVWATVLRRQAIRMVRGSEVKDDELLSWTYEGAVSWRQVGVVTYVPVGKAENILGD
jgi:hypothetical protein